MSQVNYAHLDEEHSAIALARELALLGARHVIMTDLTHVTPHLAKQIASGLTVARGKPFDAATALKSWLPEASFFAQCYELALKEAQASERRYPRLRRAVAFLSAYRLVDALPARRVLPLDLCHHITKRLGIGEWRLSRCMTCNVDTLAPRTVPAGMIRCARHETLALANLYSASA